MSRVFGLALAFAALCAAACSSEPIGPGPVTNGAGDVGGSSATTGPGRRMGNADGGGLDGAAGTCGAPAPADPLFACGPTFLQHSIAGCQRVIACGGFLVATTSDGVREIRCGYRADGALAWAQRCDEAPIHCGTRCISSLGAPDPIPSCPLPDPCDAAVDSALP